MQTWWVEEVFKNALIYMYALYYSDCTVYCVKHTHMSYNFLITYDTVCNISFKISNFHQNIVRTWPQHVSSYHPVNKYAYLIWLDPRHWWTHTTYWGHVTHVYSCILCHMLFIKVSVNNKKCFSLNKETFMHLIYCLFC